MADDQPDQTAGVSRRDLLMTGSLAAVAGRSAAAGVAGVLAAATQAGAEGAAERPHVLFILADDLGWKDVGFHGSDIATPNIDKLAETGARLESFYVQPMCTPTRAALMTGRYPMRYGLQTGVILSAGTYGLATDEWLLPQALREAGYATAIVGKWHLGHADQAFWPHERGFDLAYGPLIGEIDHFDHTSHGVTDWYRNGAVIEEEGYDTTLFGAEAVRVIETHDTASPLFLYLAFTAPHTPYQAPQEYLDRYAHIADESRRAYAAMITAMDEEIGRVVDALERAGMREDTLIVFCSDNGGTRDKMFAGEGAVAGELPPDNGPYRAGKGSLYEGGTRVVALANWPGRIAPGVVDGMMHMVDMYPTLAALAGADTARSKPLDGMDVWGTLSANAPSPRVEVVYNIEPYRGAVRQGDWKVVWMSLLPPSIELFDLTADPSEAENQAAVSPARTEELQARIVDLAAEAAPALFISESLRIGLSGEPAFPDGNLANLGAHED